MDRADALRPMHRSVLETHQRARGYRPRPVNMSTVALTSEQRECIERIALGIFTDMTNSGATLQETLAAVYLSGSENALAAYREPANVKWTADREAPEFVYAICLPSLTPFRTPSVRPLLNPASGPSRACDRPPKFPRHEAAAVPRRAPHPGGLGPRRFCACRLRRQRRFP